MSQVICSSCFEVEDTTKRFIELPYVCALCEKDSALAIEQDVWEAEYVGPACQQAAEEVHGLYIEEKDNIPCDAPYNSGVPCQSALDSVQADVYDIQDDHNADVLDQFDEDTKLIDDLRLQLEQANLNVQILEETIEDLENQLTDLRLDMCNVVFRTHF